MEDLPVDLSVSGGDDDENMTMFEKSVAPRVRELKGSLKQLIDELFTKEGVFNHEKSAQYDETLKELERIYAFQKAGMK